MAKVSVNIRCAFCGEDSSRKKYYACKSCNTIFCSTCGQVPARKDGGFWRTVGTVVVSAIADDLRCPQCFNKNTGNGGESRNIYDPDS